MAIKVDTRLYAPAKSALLNAQKKAAAMTAEQMRTEVITEQSIPFDTGFLQNTQTYVELSKSSLGLIKIIHDTPYALRLYYHPEYNFQTTFNMNAGGLWWDDWLTGSKKKRPRELFKQFYKKESGGYVK